MCTHPGRGARSDGSAAPPGRGAFAHRYRWLRCACHRLPSVAPPARGTRPYQTFPGRKAKVPSLPCIRASPEGILRCAQDDTRARMDVEGKCEACERNQRNAHRACASPVGGKRRMSPLCAGRTSAGAILVLVSRVSRLIGFPAAENGLPRDQVGQADRLFGLRSRRFGRRNFSRDHESECNRISAILR